MQWCTCSEWVHLRCSLLSFSKVNALGSSQSWNCPLDCICPSRCVLSCLHCCGLLISHFSRIDRIEVLHAAASVVIRPKENLSSYFALSSYVLFEPLALWRIFLSVGPLVHSLGSWSASRAPRSSVMSPSFGRGRVTTITTISLSLDTPNVILVFQ